MTPADQEHRYVTARSAGARHPGRAGRRPARTLPLALLAAALACPGCAGAGPAARGSAIASGSSALAVVREESAADVAARERAWADEQARETAAQAAATAQAELDRAVAALEAEGLSVSYAVLDISTGATIEHNADAVYYSASSIKGPFCVSMVRALGAEARGRYGDAIRACLANSDNDAYRTLRKDTYGQTFFRDLADEAGVKVDLAHWYNDYSARDLARYWAACDKWLAAGGEDAAWLGDILQDTLNSQVDDIAGGEGVTTWSKAGWYPGGDEGAVTFDGGAVHTGTGDYAIAVAVDRGSDFEAIRSIMEPLVTLRGAQASSA